MDTLQSCQSDALWRACTGEGFSKRQIYADDDAFIYSFRRSVGLNGINIAVTRADLLGRSILIGLERIARKDRRAEEDLEAGSLKARPHILGGMLDGHPVAAAVLQFMSETTDWEGQPAELLVLLEDRRGREDRHQGQSLAQGGAHPDPAPE